MGENSSKTSLSPFSISHLKDATCEMTRFGISVKGGLNRPKYFFTLVALADFGDVGMFIEPKTRNTPPCSVFARKMINRY